MSLGQNMVITDSYLFADVRETVGDPWAAPPLHPCGVTLYLSTTSPAGQNMCMCAIKYIYVFFVLLFVCEACKVRCAHLAWVRYHAIKTHLLLITFAVLCI